MLGFVEWRKAGAVSVEKIHERESRTLEFHEAKLGDDMKTYLKTVSAFANYHTGRILFGVRDDGNVVPVSDPMKLCLSIRNQIDDNLEPIPDFSLSIEDNGTVALYVEKGEDTPYLYKGVAYHRSDSTSRPVDRQELRKLSLRGMNLSFENLRAQNQELTFNTFRTWCQDKIGLEDLSLDTLKTFQLYTDQNGFTNAALLLSDQNSFPGVDIVRFGEDHSQILERRILQHSSVLEVYEQACAFFESRYSFEKVEGFTRKLFFTIPPEAFREVLANALVHRDWDSTGNIQIAFDPEGVTVLSQGGHLDGLHPEDCLNRRISIPCNQNLAIVFNRLGLIEKFGTGIDRIKKSYHTGVEKPHFHISDRLIEITLPVLHTIGELSPEEQRVLQLIRSGVSRRQDLSEWLGYTQYTLTKILKVLQEKKLITKTGSTRNAVFTPSDI